MNVGRFPKLTLILAALTAASAAAGRAAEAWKLDSLKAGGKIYRQVIVLGASETDLYFKHAGGIGNVKLRYLEPALQKRFEYDPQAAEAVEERQMQEDNAYLAALAQQAAERAQNAAAAAAAAALLAERVASSETSLADPITESSLLNRPAPKLDFGRWLGDAPDLEGKAVLVLFWTTWSVPCRKAIKEMNAHQKTFRDRLTVIGLAGQTEQAVADFTEVKADFPLAADPTGALAGVVGVSSVPNALLMDAAGIVRFLGHPAALGSTQLKQLLAAESQ